MPSPSPLQLEQLRLFLTVASAGSFSRAAILSGSTQSAVSKRVLALERELRCELFERTGRGARLTDTGRALLPRAEALLSDVDRLADSIAADAGRPRGEVRLAVQQSVSWPLVGIVHRQAKHAFPDVRLAVYEAPMIQIDEWLREGRVDFAVLSRLPRDDPSGAAPLFLRTLHLVAARGDPATRASTIPFARLAGMPMIAASLSNAGRLLIEEEARRRGWQLNVVMEVNSIHLAKRLVAGGAAYWIASRRAVAAEIESGTLSASRIVRPVIRQRFYLTIAGKGEPTLAVRTIADLVRDIARRENEP